MARRYLTGLPIDRLMASVVATPGRLASWCWVSTYSTDEKGYARITIKGRTVKAHKFAYEQRFGAVPSGLELDHLCHNRACVNPDHLEAVTHLVNMERAMGATHVAHREGRCLLGHPTDGVCRICANERNRKWRASVRQKEAVS